MAFGKSTLEFGIEGATPSADAAPRSLGLELLELPFTMDVGSVAHVIAIIIIIIAITLRKTILAMSDVV